MSIGEKAILNQKKLEGQKCADNIVTSDKKVKRGELLVKFALLFLFILMTVYVAGLFTFGYVGIRQ